MQPFTKKKVKREQEKQKTHQQLTQLCLSDED